MSSPTELPGLQASVQVLLQEVWNFVGSLGDNAAEESSSAWLVDQQWRHFKNVCTRLIERSENRGLSVAVVALSKSGKSTLLNALLGSSCLPTNSVPETPRVCVIHHTPRPQGSKPKLIESSGRTSTGSQAVRQRLQELHDEHRYKENLWRMEQPLEIYAALHGLPESAVAMQLSLIDAPGPNEAKSEFLKHMIEKLVQDIDAAVYVLDYTKLKTADEAEMLQAIRKINPALMHRIWHRMFFVVNKFDVASTGHGLDEAETKYYVKTLLRDAGFNVKSEQILLVSANNALLSRLVLDDMADQSMRTKFGRLAFGMEYEMVIDRVEWHTRAQRMLESSGIQQLEEQVFGFLYKHSGLIKVLSLLDDLVKLLQDVGNVASSYKAALSRNLGEMTMNMERLKAQLDDTMMEFDAAKSGLQRIEDDVVSKVRDALQKLRQGLLLRINFALSNDDEDDGGSVQSSLSPGWRIIHEAFVEMVSRQETERGHVEDMLRSLHEDLTAQVSSEIDIAWSTIADLARERHQELVFHTNEHLDRLSHQIDALIGKELGIRLEGSDVTFKPPETREFHAKLDELLQRGIQEKSIKRNALYRYVAGGDYKIYYLNGDSICAHFETRVREAAEHCLRAVQGPFQDHIAHQIQMAEARLQEYSDHCLQAVQSEIDGRATHINAHAGIMHKLLEDLRSIKRLKISVVERQRQVEAFLRPISPLNGRESAGGISDTDILGDSSEETVAALFTSSGQLQKQGSGVMRRYIPPHSRFQHDTMGQMLASGQRSPLDRSESMPAYDIAEVLWDPQSQGLGMMPVVPVTPDGHGNGNSNLNGNGIDFDGSRRAEGSNWRARQGSSFQPKSDFFRSFDKALRGGRTASSSGSGGRRARGGHRRTTSWA